MDAPKLNTMKKTLLLITLLLLCTVSSFGQQTTFTPNCGGDDDTARFTSLIATIGSNTGTIRLPSKNGGRCAVNDLTIPANIALDNSDGTGVSVNSGKILTVQGPIVNPIGRPLFFGLGTVVLAGNPSIGSVGQLLISGGDGTSIWSSMVNGLTITQTSGGALTVNNGVTLQVGSNVALSSQLVDSQTSGASLSQLETAVNELKAALAVQGLINFPIDLSTLPGALLGWRADIQSHIDNDPVPTVTDSSGNGNTGNQPTGANQPVFKTAVQNNRSVIRFDGSNDYLSLNSPLSTVRTVYLVYKQTGASQDNRTPLGHATLFDWHGGSGTLMLSPTNAAAAVMNGSAYVNGFLDTAANIERPTSEFRVLAFVTTGNTNVGAIFTDRLVAGRFLAGDLAEIWLYSAQHTAPQVASAVGALKLRWGVTNATPLRRRVVLDGDSITNNSYAVRVVNCLVGNCASPSPITNNSWFSTNYAVSGQTIVMMQSDAATEIDPTYSGHRAKEVLAAFGGTNDLYFGSSLASLQTNYQAYCTSRRAAGFKVVAATILPRSNSGTPGTFEANRLAFNTWLRANYTTFADALADFAANGTMGCTGCETNATFYLDLVHPTDAGNDILAPIVRDAVNAIP